MMTSPSKNMFDDLPTVAAPRDTDLRDELDRFLSTDPEHVKNVLAWWFERQHIYPQLSRMALDYLSIPGVCYVLDLDITNIDIFIATSVNVERVFSQGRILLSHLRSRLSVESTRALMCVGA
jgi:hypothetical protein